MNKTEARQLLHEHLAQWELRSYGELSKEIGQSCHVQVTGRDGTRYQIEIDVVWDHEPHGDIRIMGAIDDGGWRAFLPLTEDSLVSLQERFEG